MFDSKLGKLKEPILFARKPPSTAISIAKTVPVGMTPTGKPPSIMTDAIAAEGNMFISAGVTGQVGLYGSGTPEVGVFVSAGGGVWFPNIGWSVGPTITVVPFSRVLVRRSMGCHNVPDRRHAPSDED